MPDSMYDVLDSSVPQIRLFTLLPASDPEAPIQGHLHTVSLHSAPAYEGLSYAWGNAAIQKDIAVNGHSLTVTANLELALRGLRSSTDARVIWVDNICINQASTAERNHQVTLMRTIYSKCTQDLLWIGPLDNCPGPKNKTQSERDIEVWEGMKLLSNMVQRDQQTLQTMQARYQEKRSNWGSYIDHRDDAPERALLSYKEQDNLYAFLKQPVVWHRLWVMQEISIAPKVLLVFGPHTLEWDVVSNFLGDEPYADAFHGTFGHGTLQSITRYFDLVQTIDHQRRVMKDIAKGEGESTLIDVLARFRHTDSSDPRDKIYGLLGLVSEKVGFNVDYSKPYQQVYMEVTEWLINNSGNLDIICQSPWQSFHDPSADANESSLPGPADTKSDPLPSWVANFMQDGEVKLFAQRNIYNAGRPSCEVPCRIISSSTLQTKGTILGHIGPIKQAKIRNTYLERDALPYKWFKSYLDERWLDASESPHAYVTGESVVTAYWRTLVMDTESFPKRRLTPEMVDEEDKYVRDRYLELLHKPPTRNEYGFYAVESLYQKWIFCLTDNNLYTMITPPTREGDVVACVDGAKVPLVLRPVGSGSQIQYQLVSVAYVHGFMDMEAIESNEMREKLGLKEQDIFLV
ncbi:heterokaryon incompatibility protein-domain-containing protein [Stachybotrys elegans]|uniref:Heterokaryon incompatibility protein-domain-containing protein n=1 Tax=Stachybotrys elegans TaxID=80388 RepID=A0A8K0WTN3_9HYPO|nr:heterokaryon incompatibility protein-domain-containing protein [Stachybotrys elegans]